MSTCSLRWTHLDLLDLLFGHMMSITFLAPPTQFSLLATLHSYLLVVHNLFHTIQASNIKWFLKVFSVFLSTKIFPPLELGSNFPWSFLIFQSICYYPEIGIIILLHACLLHSMEAQLKPRACVLWTNVPISSTENKV